MWSVRHHDAGEWLASCSLDHSVRLWDLVAAKSRQILRGHVDSVNDCAWQHYTNNLCTGEASLSPRPRGLCCVAQLCCSCSCLTTVAQL